MHSTVFCTFNRTVGWRVHSVINVHTTSISVVTVNGIKMLSIPVVVRLRKGQFCNPAKLLTAVVRQIKQPVTFVNDEVTNNLCKIASYVSFANLSKSNTRPRAMLH